MTLLVAVAPDLSFPTWENEGDVAGGVCSPQFLFPWRIERQRHNSEVEQKFYLNTLQGKCQSQGVMASIPQAGDLYITFWVGGTSVIDKVGRVT